MNHEAKFECLQKQKENALQQLEAIEQKLGKFVMKGQLPLFLAYRSSYKLIDHSQEGDSLS